MGSSIAAVIGGAFGVGIGWGLRRMLHPDHRVAYDIVHRLVLRPFDTPTVSTAPVPFVRLIDWQTDPDFDLTPPLEDTA